MLSSQPNGWARSRHVEAHPREPVIPAVGFHVLLVVRGSALRALTLSIFGIVHILLVVTGCDLNGLQAPEDVRPCSGQERPPHTA